MAYGFYGDLVYVRSTPLTPGGSRVETAFRDFKQDAREKAVHFITGHTKVFPELKISAPQPGTPDCHFQHPYGNGEELYELAEQSQVGTTTNTVYRLDARRSREFSNVEELNDSWKDEVASVCEKVRQNLAPGASKVTASLYKLLLYREGDFFNMHQDAQHSTHMFATLLFFLPVYHEGGQFCLYDPGNFRSAKKILESPVECTWVSFFTDVHHEVDKVKKGYRVVLNYSLSFEGSMSPWSILPSLSPVVASAISYYFTSSSKVLALPLTYNYTLATLSADFLKGIDAYLYSAICQIASIDLQYVMRFGKTKIIPGRWGDEDDHDEMFQGIYTVHSDLAKKFFDIESESEQQFREIDNEDDDRNIKYREITNKRDSQYQELMKTIKETQKYRDVEWIVPRNSEGNTTEYTRGSVNFTTGQLGWLGNMCPAEEYYYLHAAMILRKKN